MPHNWIELADWLKGSIPGIIVLGAAGSIAAVLLSRLYLVTVNRVLPAPLRIHRRQRLKQAFHLGYLHAQIDNDKTGRLLVSFLVYRVARLAIALAACLLFVLVVSTALLSQSRVVLTLTMFLGSSCAFLAAYWVYYEFEYIYRSYLVHWKPTLQQAEKSYDELPRQNPKPVPKNGNAPTSPY